DIPCRNRSPWVRNLPEQQNKTRNTHTIRRARRFLRSLLTAFAILAQSLAAEPLPPTSHPLLNPTALTRLPRIIERNLANDKIPGAVVVIGSPEQIIYQQFFGARAWQPHVEMMTSDTIFDIASLTKVVATTTAILQLHEKNLIDLDAPAARYWPDFAASGKATITLRQLLTHYSGLRPDIPLRKSWQGHAQAMQMVIRESPRAAPGSEYVYSDINFMVLAEIVQRVSGTPFAKYCAKNIFDPLRMHDTKFNPAAAQQQRIAPTLVTRTQVLRGTVHDPIARQMGGVAGHAGLFSTAADLARFARMLMNAG